MACGLVGMKAISEYVEASDVEGNHSNNTVGYNKD